MSINLFGSPQIKRGNELFSIQRRKDLALLVYLLSTAQPQSRDTLATLLWPDQTQIDARSNLRKSLSRLKSRLGEEALLVSQNQVGFNPKVSINLDTAQFHSFISQFHQHSHIKRQDAPSLCGECQNLLEEAVRLYCADFLQGFSVPDSSVFEEWQFFQSESLRRNLAEALEQLTLQFTFAGNYDRAIEYCSRWLSLDKLHEPPHRHLMLLYALSGQQAAALRQFKECARLLKNELDAEPEAETIHLYKTIQKKQLGELAKTWGKSSLPESKDQIKSPLQPGQNKIHNVPVHPGALIGREKELEEILKILNEPSCQLLTLLGPGGSGKTRLALQIATTVSTSSESAFKDGVVFIPLAPVTDPKSLVDVMIEGLRITGRIQGAGPHQKLAGHMHGRQMLLVIDNFEHLLGMESIQLISDILDAAPLSKVLITSRERLNIRGEYLFRVEGLKTPDDDLSFSRLPADSVFSAFSALQLFEQCATRIHPSFRITQENYLPIVQICRHVQGMPLAIELAASWLEVFSAEEIKEEIQRSLDFLQSNWRDLPDRQRSLRAVFDSSWELLDKQTRPVVKALSIFRTSFTREAAQAVAGASAKALLDLTNKSWIQRLSNGRYQIHELLKQFVYEKLSKDESILEQVRDQYCEYYTVYTHSLWNAMKGAAQKQAYVSIEIEFDNINTAWMWLVSKNKYELAVYRMLPVLFHYAELRGKIMELLGMLNTALRSLRTSGKDRNPPEVEIILRTARSSFFEDGFPLRFSIHDAIFPVILENLQQAWWQAKKSVGLHELGFWGILLAYNHGRLIDRKESIRRLKQMIPHFRKNNQLWELATAYLHLLKLMVPNRENADDQVDTLTSYLTQAMEIFDTLGDRINMGHMLSLWGELKYMQHDVEGAIEHWNTARAIFLSVNEWGTATNVFWLLIDAYLQLGDFPKAYEYCREMANVYMQQGIRWSAVGALSKESYEKARYGDLTDALQIRQQCIDLIHETGLEYQFAWNYWEMGELVRLSGDLAHAEDWFERSHKIFDKEKDNIGKSFYYRGMGDVAVARGEFESARLHFGVSVKLSRTANHTWMIAYAEQGLGRAELKLGHNALAEKHIIEAFKLAKNSRDQGIILVVLAAYAELLEQQGKLEKAVRLASVVHGHFLTWHETRKRSASLLADLKKSISSAKFAKAEKRGSSTNLWELVDELTSS